MADQDFNIKVVTTADTSGIRQTSDALKNLQQQQKDFLAGGPAQTGVEKFIAAQKAKAAATAAASDADKEGSSSLTGTAIGLGTIVTLVTFAIRRWKEFNDEQDRMVDNMIKAEEHFRALGESILDVQDKARSAARVGMEPLEQSFIRLQQEIIRLKTEQNLLNLPEQGDEWKKLNSDIATNEALLKGVTSSLQKQAEEKQKAARSELEKRVPGLKPDDQIKEADAQTQAILKNEQAAAQARAEGREKDADMFQKSADQYKASATPKQLADLQRIHDLQDQLAGKQPAAPFRQPQPGEPGGGETGEGGAGLSPAENLLNMLNRNSQYHRSNDASLQRLRDQQRAGTIEQEEKQSPDLAETNKYIKQVGGKPITQAQKDFGDLKASVDDLGRKFDRYWG